MSIEPTIYGPFSLNLDTGQLFRLDIPIGDLLTDAERRVLSTIMSLKGEIARYEIFQERDKGSVNYYVHEIRQKLGSQFSLLVENERGDGYRFRLHTRDLNGRRVHIAGSFADDETLQFAHKLINALVKKIMQLGGGFVVSAGGDPKVGVGRRRVSQIFDWTVLEAARDSLNETRWCGVGKRIVNVHADETAPSRVELWQSFLRMGEVEHFTLSQNPRVGDVVEELQVRFGDVLIAIGGRLGVEMLAQRYRRQQKHVIPLDFERAGKVRKQFSAARNLRAQALQEHCEGWFSLRNDSSESPAVLLELTNAAVIPEACSRIVNLLQELAPPVCLVLVPRECPPQTEQWRLSVASHVLKGFGFQVMPVHADTISIDSIASAALTVIDLSDTDPYSVLRAGVAMGSGANFICVAREGSLVSLSMPVFRYKAEDIQREARQFRDFVANRLSRQGAIA